MALLAACGGDTIKLFDVRGGETGGGDPCTLQYAPSPGLHINCARWNHTNLVVASAGEDRKISLWLKSGRPLGTVPSNEEAPDIVEETIMSINFTTKGSRYLCSGGTGKLVRIWDMQRRRCIKWLKGHTDTITGVMYNCKDEHLASISIQGDLILHNLASGSRAAELKDPHNQVLRVLDYSKLSRHLLVTAGDDGSVHIWDATVRNPKASWLNQHLAPTSGVCFSPCSDKVIVSVGLDKKLYMFDPGMKKPAYYASCEAPYSSLAFRDDGGTLAAGTNNGRVIFYDIRSKPQPLTVLRAYGSSEPVTSLSWQKSSPVSVNEANCSAEVALLGSAGEDSVLMPDPLPAVAVGLRSRSAATSIAFRTFGRIPSSGLESSVAVASGNGGPVSFTVSKSRSEETPSGNHLWTNGKMSWLQTARSFSIGKDDMEVFSPLVDVQPITPSNSSYWDTTTDSKKDLKAGDELRRPVVKSPPAGVRRLLSNEEMKDEGHQKLERRLASRLDDLQIKSLSTSPVAGTPLVPGKADRSPSLTPPEAWGGDGPTDRGSFHAHTFHGASRASLESSTMSQHVLGYELLLEPVFPSTGRSDPSPTLSTYSGPLSSSSGSVEKLPSTNIDALTLEATLCTSPRKPVERGAQSGSVRASATSADGFMSGASPRQTRAACERHDVRGALAGGSDLFDNKTGARLDFTSATSNGHVLTNLHQTMHQQATPSFALQLVQRALEESLGSVQKAIHEDVQNLHLELLRQFHIQQTEMAAIMKDLMTKQSDLMEEIQALRTENQQLRQFY
ncbi:hypothetical protein O6H91_12G039200 [Diphasiastrum complanatum]|uniref:Uncharacterized protein n=2 Tax=Diphasiastrum complanatum TaxID=34168 RepID=A0ACC2C0N7_DIPCM|nr:hypothetical protein O6H91_12G039200 [Diphasiastrum complanatum]